MDPTAAPGAEAEGAHPVPNVGVPAVGAGFGQAEPRHARNGNPYTEIAS
jgi:hypothetical protein